MKTEEDLLVVEHLYKDFVLNTGLFKKKTLRAVDDVSFRLPRGQTLGLAGESGSGKSTVARLILRLTDPTSGSIRFEGRDILKLSPSEMRRLRREIQMVFQDPFASLNPRKTIRYILSRPFLLHGTPREQVDAKVRELLETVGLTPASTFVDRYPHEFSGGQRQRIALARAMALRSKLIVADEPVSSLDLSVRAQVLELMRELSKELHLTYLFITHDLAVMRSMVNRVAIMYLGQIVELSEVEEFYSGPLHPYSKVLLSATPLPDPRASRTRRQIRIKGEIPSPLYLPSGCRFHTRCPFKLDKCSEVEPIPIDAGNGHIVSCHLVTGQ